jgi:hypothetical protein
MMEGSHRWGVTAATVSCFALSVASQGPAGCGEIAGAPRRCFFGVVDSRLLLVSYVPLLGGMAGTVIEEGVLPSALTPFGSCRASSRAGRPRPCAGRSWPDPPDREWAQLDALR